MLDPRRLRLLVLLDGLGTVRAVARAASMSPSAVSQQLAVLEREAGSRLLQRHGRNVVLTGSGVALAAHGREILDRIDVAEEDLRTLREQPAGTVTVAAFTSALRAFGLRAAAAVGAAHPRVRVRLVERAPEACVTAVERGEADLAIVGELAGTLRPTPHLRKVALTEDALYAVLPAGHPAGGGPVRLRDLRDDVWGLDGTTLERHLLLACREAGFEPEIAARLFTHEALLGAVREGLAVTVLPGLALLDAAGVVTQPLSPGVGRVLSALHRPDALARRSVELTLEAIVAAAGEAPA